MNCRNKQTNKFYTKIYIFTTSLLISWKLRREDNKNVRGKDEFIGRNVSRIIDKSFWAVF